ncbi:uncharacterized protein LOC127800545 isoform X2 [Diospyros lotus]|uniref:uncharacterized protein LOC127800545 isoform X2 n=1 Tax=Diospyros lotus TaxID=55363 RepID=UPI0022540FB8|nr:uncharacterized protein LOC127800545 isoform X2 [Diospyros lotus]
MGRHQNHRSLRSKAAHFVSDLTVFLNPISDKPSKPNQPPSPPSIEYQDEMDDRVPQSMMKDSSGKKSLFSRGKQSVGRAFHHAARLGGFRNQASERKGSSDMKIDGANDSKVVEEDCIGKKVLNETGTEQDLPEISEPSLLLSEKTRRTLYLALPALVQGRKWVLLYSTWRHGISLATLYRRTMLCPGLSLLVVGDRSGAVFGGLVDGPLRPTNKRKYQGTNNSFVFTSKSGHPVIFWPTGINRYFTLCTTDFLALGGGGHFALYLDGDLLNGSSSASETYGNSCLACSEDFEVKEIELWGFVYASQYEEIISMLRTEAPGICRW